MIRPELVVAVTPLHIVIFIRDAGFWKHIAEIQIPYSFEEFKLWYDITNQNITRLCFDIDMMKFYITKDRFESNNLPEKEVIDAAFKGHIDAAKLLILKKLKRSSYYYTDPDN